VLGGVEPTVPERTIGMSDDGFLTRWSRRKRAAEAAGQPRAAAVEGEVESAPGIAGGTSAAGDSAGAAPEAELSADVLADLPRLEELTAESDVSLFLRRGVPESLRNAALRRMWSLDPKIRDFLSEAREYAYDWNTPGGVPGSGPLLSGEEARRLAARILGARDEAAQPDEAGSATPSVSQSSEAAAHETQPADEGAAVRTSGAGDEPERPSDSAEVLERPAKLAEVQTTAGHSGVVSGIDAMQERTDGSSKPSLRRRHGGALPS
jgi:Protein of unknown function (DUF3306)